MSYLGLPQLFLPLFMLGASFGGMHARPAHIILAPTLTMDPNGVTPLAGVVELATARRTRAVLTITDGLDTWRVVFPRARREHSLPVLGLKPDTAYTIKVNIVPGGPIGTILAVTEPLPDDFPVVSAEAIHPRRMEPGFTLLDCFRRQGGDPRPAYTMVVDNSGDVVWYSTECAIAIRREANGNLFFNQGPVVYEMDMLGNKTQLAELQKPGEVLHHDLFRTARGTYLSLSKETVEIAGYPTSDSDPTAPTQTAQISDEPAVEFAPDGSVLNEWPLHEMIDPTRIGYNSLDQDGTAFDWAHSNAVLHDPRDDSVIMSIRHQDAVIKFARNTGELIWILGPHANWASEFQPFLLQPIGAPFDWQFHQHAPMITPANTLVMFDNGTVRSSPFDGEPLVPNSEKYSRAVEYAIDEANMEVRQVWEYGEDAAERVYAAFIGDADWLPRTGNILITFGGARSIDGVPLADLNLGTLSTKIVEVDHQEPAEKLFDLFVYDPPAGQVTTYRSERIPSLYPDDVRIFTHGPPTGRERHRRAE